MKRVTDDSSLEERPAKRPRPEEHEDYFAVPDRHLTDEEYKAQIRSLLAKLAGHGTFLALCGTCGWRDMPGRFKTRCAECKMEICERCMSNLQEPGERTILCDSCYSYFFDK